MKPMELKIARIGNSRGVRLPAEVIKRYRMDSVVLMEETAEGIFLRPSGPVVNKLSWQETAAEMAAEGEDWSEWDSVVGDGLETAPWDHGEQRKVTEKTAVYGAKPGPMKSKIRRFEIRWTDMNPTRGAEMGKARPAVIVSKDDLNACLQTVVICPLTSRLHPRWKSRLPVTCESRAAEIAVDQIRTVSRARLGRKLGSLSDIDAAALARLLVEMYGD
jgi:mRNA interferase MazF